MGGLKLAPSLDPGAADAIRRFIRHRVEQAGARGVVLGVSGGVDSTVVGALCARALGRERVLGLLMPEREPEPEAILAIEWLRIPHKIVPIRRILERIIASGGGEGGGGRSWGQDLERTAEGNVKARIRMVLLYLEANRSGRLVMGTGNKSEILTGYFTKYGDGAADVMPIGDLYKTQVSELAAQLGVPERIRSLAPSAGLYTGQTDEAELGVPYETLDRVLLGLELGLGPEELRERTGAKAGDIKRVMGLVEASAHKRLLPQIPKLGIRTVGLDWREELLHRGD